VISWRAISVLSEQVHVPENSDFRSLLLSQPGGGRRIAPDFHIDTSVLPAKDQARAVEDEMAAFISQVNPHSRHLGHDGYRSSIKGYSFHNLPILTVESEACTFVPSERQDPYLTDRYPWIFMLRLSGTASFYLDGRTLDYGPGRLNIRTPRNQQVGTVSDSETLMLYLEPDQFSGLEDSLNWLATADGARHTPWLLEHYLSALGRVLPDVAADDAPVLAETTISMIRASISGNPDDVVEASSAMRAARLEIARKHVDAHLTSPGLTPDSLGKVLGLSERRVRNLFEHLGGAQNFIRARRLNACRKAILEGGGRSISEIAEAFGFSSSAHFSRVFKAQFGWSPSEVREMTSRILQQSTHESWLKAGDTPRSK